MICLFYPNICDSQLRSSQQNCKTALHTDNMKTCYDFVPHIFIWVTQWEEYSTYGSLNNYNKQTEAKKKKKMGILELYLF